MFEDFGLRFGLATLGAGGTIALLMGIKRFGATVAGTGAVITGGSVLARMYEQQSAPILHHIGLSTEALGCAALIAVILSEFRDSKPKR